MTTVATPPSSDDVNHAIKQLHLDTCRPGTLNTLIKHFSILSGAVRMASKERQEFLKKLRKVCIQTLN
ncbi:TPA: hypothetical protein ACOEOW_003872 [Enterobacter hormaechei subsp. xiangfangensis]